MRSDRLEEWTAELRAMKPKERPAHAGSLLWEGVVRALSRVPGRIIAVASRPQSPELPLVNSYSLLRDAEIVAIGHDGTELPVRWDPGTDSLSFLTGYFDHRTRAWVHHMPPTELVPRSRFSSRSRSDRRLQSGTASASTRCQTTSLAPCGRSPANLVSFPPSALIERRLGEAEQGSGSSSRNSLSQETDDSVRCQRRAGSHSGNRYLGVPS